MFKTTSNITLDVWLAELLKDFGAKEVPPPQKAQEISRKVQEATGVEAKKHIGHGDNGIAFLTNKNTVLKYTIDEGEATLWGMLKTKPCDGIAKSYGSWQLGSTIVYVAHVEHLPNKLQASEIHKINKANKAAHEKAQGLAGTKEKWPATHTAQLIRSYAHEGFNAIAGALKHLWDMGVRIYDLQPANFQKSKMGDIKIIDPSVPSLPVGSKPPHRIAFESKLKTALHVGTIEI